MSNAASQSESPSDDDTNMTDSADLGPSTPPSQIQAAPTSELSPPDSRGGPRLPSTRIANPNTITANSSAPIMPPSEVLNEHGKRPFTSADANNVAAGGSSATNATSMAPPATTGKFSDPGSGYTWDKDEDAPGFSWLNPKAKEEIYRATSQIVDLDKQVKMRYGDVLLDTQ